MINFPIFLTLTRLALLPIIVILFFMPYDWAAWSALGIYIFAALTDFLDGWWARRFDKVTSLGALLDPIVDKIFIAVLFLLLVGTGRLPGFWIILPILILSREFLVSGLREFMGPHNLALPVRKLAKWKTALQMFSVALLIIGPFLDYALEAGRICLTLATLLTLGTGYDYLKASLAHVRQIR